MARITETMRKLFEFLKERSASESDGRFTRDQVVEATGYAESSIKAYVSKGFLARWVSEVDGTHSNYRVRSFQSVGFSDFAKAMSQNDHQLLDLDEREWRRAMDQLLSMALRKDYALSASQVALVEKLSKGRT